jgi:hypothetical protein
MEQGLSKDRGTNLYKTEEKKKDKKKKKKRQRKMELINYEEMDEIIP